MDVLFLSFEFNFYSNILIEYQNRAVREAPSRIPRWTKDDSNRVSDLENHKITKKHKEIHQKKMIIHRLLILKPEKWLINHYAHDRVKHSYAI